MTVSFQHHHDYAVVPFTGVLDWPSCIAVVASVDTAIDAYFYHTVEIAVTSPGGDAHALTFLIAALNRWRKQGVRIRTRVNAHAKSAAAIMVALGEERVAEPGATLHFHHPHAVIHNDALTARQSSSLSSALQRIDDQLLCHLVERAFDGSLTRTGRSRHAADPSDRHVLEHVWTALAKTVDEAIRDGDCATVSRIYRRLMDTDLSISATLACTLRLLDRIGPVVCDASRFGGTPGLTIPQWSALYPPRGSVPREVLARHTLILGETGSGKTASAILPVVASMARAPRDVLGTALIIDPKRELAPALEDLAPQRIHHVDARTAVLDLMAGPRWRVAEELEAERWYTAATLIVYRAASFIPGNPARVLLQRSPGTRDEFFDREGSELVLCVLAAVLMVMSPRAPSPEEWLRSDREAVDFVRELIARAKGCPGERGPNILALAAWVLDGPLMTYPHREGRIRITPGSEDEWLFTRIARAALAVWGTKPGQGRDVLNRVLGYWDTIAAIDRQYAGVRATARVVCSAFASPVVANTLYFGFEPGFVTSRGGTGVDFTRAVSREGGPLVHYQPARDGLDVLVAMALKAIFFEAVLDDDERTRGSAAGMPLAAYVADEFQRFITSDPVHGEQSFLDSCRSFGAFCVLASQSLAALEHALAYGGGNSTQNEASIGVLCNNTSTKLLFRTTDPITASRLHDLCPLRPGLPAVSKVRPLSTLAPGECYAVLADGRFERRQLEPFVPERSESRDRDRRHEKRPESCSRSAPGQRK